MKNTLDVINFRLEIAEENIVDLKAYKQKVSKIKNKARKE